MLRSALRNNNMEQKGEKIRWEVDDDYKNLDICFEERKVDTEKE